MISIIIRTKNEERWIAQCLQQIKNQTFKDIEIILVDNQSNDKTVDRAKSVFPKIKLVEIIDFKPGLAINEGVRASSGDFIVILSAHCVPVNDEWLENLYKNILDPSIAGVYGRQVPMKNSIAQDKRDLAIVFGRDKRIQKKDYFFHNANSIIRRDTWNKFPFDESVTNIEDRVWGKEVIEAGYEIIYEPEASVIHHHGIHQNNDTKRARSIVKIMEVMNLSDSYADHEIINPENLEVAIVIPMKGSGFKDEFQMKLFKKTIESAKSSKLVNKIIVSTDSYNIKKVAEDLGTEVPFLRPKELSKQSVRVDEVLKYTLEQFEALSYYPDIIVPMEISMPFRPQGLIDNLIRNLVEQGMETMVAGYAEYKIGWRKKAEEYIRIDEFDIQRSEREPIHIALFGLGFATYPDCIRSKKRIGDKVGIFEIDATIAKIEIRSSGKDSQESKLLFNMLTNY
ncbi:glycosyltransferase [Candidatus Thioglobus sp.]|nr:glycosyltransferase [Candidatus Thioglobus sp.]